MTRRPVWGRRADIRPGSKRVEELLDVALGLAVDRQHMRSNMSPCSAQDNIDQKDLEAFKALAERC